MDAIGNGRVHEEPKIIQHENNDATGGGLCRRNPDDHRLRDLLQKGRHLRQASDEMRWRLLQRSRNVRQMLQGRNRLREVLQKVTGVGIPPP